MKTGTTTINGTAGLTGSMLINSLLESTADYTDRSNARKGLLRFAAKNGVAPDTLTVRGDGKAYRIVLRSQIIETAAPIAAQDPLLVPEFLKVANRVPLTAEQQAKVDAFMASGRTFVPGTKQRDYTQVQRAILAAQEAAKKAERLSKSGLDIKQETTAMPSKTTKAARSATKATTTPRRAKGQTALNEVAGKKAGPNKGATVIAMLKARWTHMTDIVLATGWQKHTARAFICRIDANVESERVDGGSRYRIVA